MDIVYVDNDTYWSVVGMSPDGKESVLLGEVPKRDRPWVPVPNSTRAGVAEYVRIGQEDEEPW
jgi:hypothetical protein